MARDLTRHFTIGTSEGFSINVAVPYSDFDKFKRNIGIPSYQQESWDCQLADPEITAWPMFIAYNI